MFQFGNLVVCSALHRHPTRKSVAFGPPGWQLPLGCTYERLESPLSDVTKPKRPHYDSQRQSQNQSRDVLGDASKKRGRLKVEVAICFSQTGKNQLSFMNFILFKARHGDVKYSPLLKNTMVAPRSGHSWWIQLPNWQLVIWGEGKGEGSGTKL